MLLSDIAGHRLHNQHITSAPFAKPGDVVSWLVAVQAQDYAGAKWALGLRLQQGAHEADIDRAFNAGAILRTHVLRPTWHFVTPADIRWLLALTAPRVHAVNAHRYRQLELDDMALKRSRSVLMKALQGGKLLTRDELRVALQAAKIATDGQRLAYLLMHAELDGIICSGPRRGKQFTYALLEERVPPVAASARDESLVELTRRFFAGHGPASVRDFAKWSGLSSADAKRGLEIVKDQLLRETRNDEDYWFASSVAADRQAAPAAYLLSVFDEYLIGYHDRSPIAEPEIAARLFTMGTALTYVIVIDGQIVGSWRRTLNREAVTIEINPFRRLTKAEQQAVTAAAQRYGEFLDRPVMLSEAHS